MPFLQIKNFFIVSVAVNKFLTLFDVASKVESSLEIFREMGRVCSKVVLFLINRNSRDLVKLGNLSR